MARFGTQVNQTPVDMYNPLNIGFYSDILGKAQQNLTQSAGMQAKFLEDAYGIKHIDEATHKAQIAELEKDIAGLTDADFVSPSNVIKGISKAGQKFAPYRNLVEKQVEEAKREQELRDRWGSNYIGNTISGVSLTDPTTGKLISPDQLNLTAANYEDFQKTFLQENQGLANQIRSGKSGYRPINNGSMLEFYEDKIKGITDREYLDQFVNNPKKVEEYLNKFPELTKAIKASGKDPKEYLQSSINTLSKQFIGGTQRDLSHQINPLWNESNKEKRGKLGDGPFDGINLTTYNPQPNKIEKEQSAVSKTRRGINEAKVGFPIQIGGMSIPTGEQPKPTPHQKSYPVSIGGMSIPQDDWQIAEPKYRAGMTPNTENFVKAQKEFNAIASKYNSVWTSLWKKAGFPTLSQGDKFLRTQNEFLDIVDNLEKEGLGAVTSYGIEDDDFNEKMANSIENSLSYGDKIVKDSDGKEIKSSELFKGEGKFKVLPRNDGNIDIVKDGKSYSIDVFDKEGNPTDKVDNTTTRVLKFQRDLYNGLFDASDKTLNGKPISLGKPVPLGKDTEGIDRYGIPEYVYAPPDEYSGGVNRVFVAYKDPETGEYHEFNGKKAIQVDMKDISANTAKILKTIKSK